MFDYARSDTHFLLYIYDRVRNLLIEHGSDGNNLLHDVLKNSEQTCLRTYTKEVYDATGSGKNGWSNLLQKWHSPLNNLQLSVFKTVHQWRDQTAREQDESPRYFMWSSGLISVKVHDCRYILPNNLLFVLAMQPPADMKSLNNLIKRTPTSLHGLLPSLLSAICDGVNSGLSSGLEFSEQAPIKTGIEVAPSISTVKITSCSEFLCLFHHSLMRFTLLQRFRLHYLVPWSILSHSRLGIASYFQLRR